MRRLFSLWVCLFPATAAAVPVELTHSGRLFDATGVPLDGAHEIKFALYDDPFAGNALWEEVKELTLDQGYFTALLGADVSNPIDAETLDVAAVYVGLRVDGIHLEDRIRLTSVPYARVAAVAETATNVLGGTVDATEIRVNGTLVVDADGTVVAPSAVDPLAALSCSDGDHLAHDGSGWVCSPPPDVSWEALPDAPADLLDGDDDTLASIDHCADGEILAYSEAFQSWGCEVDEVGEAVTSLDWSAITARPAGFDDDVDDDTLASLADSCADGQVPHFVVPGGTWACADLDALEEGDVEAYVTNGPIDLHEDTTLDGLEIATGPHFTAQDAVDAMGAKATDNPLHHDRYTNAEAVAAMGTKGTDNPLHHDRYTNAEAVAAMGTKATDNPLHHDRYTNAEAVAAMGTKATDNPLHHDRYTNAEAVAAMGTKATDNPLHHDRYTSAEAVAAMGAKGNTNPLHHDRYTDPEAVAAMGAKGNTNPLHHDRYSDAEAVNAMGAKSSTNALNHDRYTNAEAVVAMGTKADNNPLHHDRYTNAEAVAAMGAKGDTNPLNHDRYNDASAVAAVAAADSYVRNTGDALTGGLTVDNLTVTGSLTAPAFGNAVRVRAKGGQTYCAGSYQDISGLSTAITTTGGDLQIVGSVSVYYGSHSALRAMIDGQYAGTFEGNGWAYVWQDGLQCTSCPGCGNWTTLHYDRLFRSIPAGNHVVTLQVYTDGACASCGVVVGNGSIDGMLTVIEHR